MSILKIRASDSCQQPNEQRTIGRSVMSGREFGKRVQTVRTEKRMDTKVLAFRAGTSEGYLYKLERGEVKDPGYRLMSQLAVALGYPGADALMVEPVVTEQDLEDIYNQRYGVRPLAERIEAAIDSVEQAAPPSAKRRASAERAPQAPPAGEPAEPPHKASPGKRRRGK